MQRITRADMQHHHETWFKPNNAALIVVGDIRMAEIKPKLEALFAGWKAGDFPISTWPMWTAATPAIYMVDKPGAVHSVVLSGTIAPPPVIGEEVALKR